MTIAYVAPFIWGDISLTYFKGVLEVAKENNTNIIFYIGNRFEDQNHFGYQGNFVYQLMSERWIDGIIIWASQIAETLPSIERREIGKRFPQVPIVTIAGSINGADGVFGDDAKGVEMLVEHLVGIHRCKKVAYVQGPEVHPLSIARKKGYLYALQKLGISMDERLISAQGGFKSEHGREAVRHFYDTYKGKLTDEIDAIVCASDIIALGVIQELEELGIHIPSEIKVVGINNKTDSRITTPPLTTIDPQTQLIGRSAAVQLMDKINNPNRSDQEVHVPAKLILRRSCGCKELDLCETDLDARNEGGRSFVLSDQVIQETTSGLAALFNDFESVLGGDYAKGFLETFCQSLIHQRDDSFIRFLSKALNLIKFGDGDLQLFQDAISLLRIRMIPLFDNREVMIMASNLWNQARTEINLASEHQYAEHKSKTDNFLYFLNDFNEKMRNTFIFHELLEIIEIMLPRAGIPGCYIVLHDEESLDEAKVKLVFAYNSGTIISIPEEGIVFDYQDLLPVSIRDQDQPYYRIVHSLYYQELRIGYIVFEGGPIDKSIYTILSNEISSAIYRSRIFDSLKESEKKREELLHSLEQENINLERKVQERTAAIQYANEAKSRFLANVSHEIRTPLNGIIGFMDLALGISTDTEIRKYLHMSMDEAEKLMLLINELLDLSKIEAGHIEIHKTFFDLEAMMEGIFSHFHVRAREKGLTFHREGTVEYPQILGDELRIRQVLTNLLGNAIKFTIQGGVILRISMKLKDSSVYNDQEIKLATLRFEVVDSGIGIDEERLDAIFEPFVQADGTITRNFGGTGLGTSISKQLVELMGGKIGASSGKGVGSVFWFELDVKCIEKKESDFLHQEEGGMETEDLSELHLRDFQLLLVEDYQANQHLIMNYLKGLPCHIEVAENGLIAIEKMKRKSYDLILMDVQMPIMDGVEATKRIRSEETIHRVSIVGITANAYDHDLQKYQKIGMDHVVTKPFRKEELRSVVMNEFHRIHRLPCQAGKLLSELDRNKELFFELLSDFRESLKTYIQEMEEGARLNDLNAISWNAHAIKGAAYNLFAERIGDLAAMIEKSAKEGHALNYVETIGELKTLVMDLEAYIEKVKS